MKFSLIENKYILFPPDRQNDCFMSYGINCFKFKVGRRSLEGCSPWGRWGLDATELLHFQFSLSCTGEGNGNPLQCSCLENPRDGGAWWAAVYGVAQSRTRLKRLSSSSSKTHQSWSMKISAVSVTSLVVQWLRLHSQYKGVDFQFLVRELRLHKQQGQKKTKKNQKKNLLLS